MEIENIISILEVVYRLPNMDESINRIATKNHIRDQVAPNTGEMQSLFRPKNNNNGK